MKYNELPEYVRKINELNITGPVCPINWFKWITFRDGKPQTVAIFILSDIVYWLRPVEVVNDQGDVVEYSVKFKGDHLQRNRRYYMNLYGFSNQQVKDAFDLLKRMGLIEITIVDVMNVNGKTLSNVPFITGVNVQLLRQITYEEPPDDWLDTLYAPKDDGGVGSQEPRGRVSGTEGSGLENRRIHVFKDTINNSMQKDDDCYTKLEQGNTVYTVPVDENGNEMLPQWSKYDPLFRELMRYISPSYENIHGQLRMAYIKTIHEPALDNPEFRRFVIDIAKANTPIKLSGLLKMVANPGLFEKWKAGELVSYVEYIQGFGKASGFKTRDATAEDIAELERAAQEVMNSV